MTLIYKWKDSLFGTENKSSLRHPNHSFRSLLMYQSCLWNFTSLSLCSMPFQQPLFILYAAGFWPCLPALLKQTTLGTCLAGSQVILLLSSPVALTIGCLDSWQMQTVPLICHIKSAGGIFSFREKWKWNPILAHPLSKTINISWLPGFPNHLKQCSCYGMGSWTLSLKAPSVLLFCLENCEGD